MDDSDFKYVYQYLIHQHFTAITERYIMGTIFDWRETVVTNVKQMAELAAKWQG